MGAFWQGFDLPEIAVTRSGLITMSMRELDRLKVIEAVVEQRLMPWRAAERLGVSRRQIERLVARYCSEGPAGLISGRRGKPSNNRMDTAIANRALAIIRERYADFGPTLACEKLWECHGLRLSKETVRHLMTDAGLWIPRRQRPPKIYQPRARRACVGQLIQIDGSEHAWFEARAPQCTLLVCVKHFGCAMYELNIDTLCINSSSPKGRVERAHTRGRIAS